MITKAIAKEDANAPTTIQTISKEQAKENQRETENEKNTADCKEP